MYAFSASEFLLLFSNRELRSSSELKYFLDEGREVEEGVDVGKGMRVTEVSFKLVVTFFE